MYGSDDKARRGEKGDDDDDDERSYVNGSREREARKPSSASSDAHGRSGLLDSGVHVASACSVTRSARRGGAGVVEGEHLATGEGEEY